MKSQLETHEAHRMRREHEERHFAERQQWSLARKPGGVQQAEARDQAKRNNLEKLR